ncbi:hypothetical protein B9Z55_025746 [Caenorhabditis nigoni]|nr:hypothetical protein B9Z55_025746 [Caenorhabditis nigoni]
MLMFSNFILLLYIVTVFSNSTTSHENEAKVVDVAVKAFTASSSNSPDVLTALNTLGPNTAVLFKSFLRIRPNVSQTLDLMLQRDEYKELINFNRPTDALWNNFADRFGVGIFRMLKDNSLKATLPMMALSELSSQYYNPKFHKHNGFIPAFEQVCLDYESGPRSITKYLVSRLVTECQTPLTPEDAKEIASHRVYFMQVLLRLQVLIDKTVPDLGLYLAEFILIRNQFKRDILSEQLCSFTQQYFYYKDAIKALFNELRTKASIENNQWEDNKPSMNCLLKHLFLSFNFNHRAMVAFADKLRNELINLTQHAAICATIMYKKDEEAIEQYQNVIVNDITRIGTHVSQYFNNSLLSAWPSTHNGILKEQMLLNSPNSTNVDQNKLKMVTNLTRSLLANTGLPKCVFVLYWWKLEVSSLHNTKTSTFC